jgi:predicted RNase H-like HicB family nuclease
MRTVQVIYRRADDGAWIATSSAAPGYVGHGDTYPQARKRVREGLPWFLEEEPIALVHVRVPAPPATTSARVSMEIIQQSQPAPRYRRDMSEVAPAESAA